MKDNCKINDEVFLIPGVDRTWMKSLWTPATPWKAVTEEGFDGGPVIPDTYDGFKQSLEQVRDNVEKSGEIGYLVAANGKSSVISVSLLSMNPDTGEILDYGEFSKSLEKIREKYTSDTIRIRITGFAKVVGDLIAVLKWFILFFVAAIVIDGGLRQAYIRCWRSTGLIVFSSLLTVVWQLGLLSVLGYELDPYSILVPFLVFSIGMSHGTQKLNGILQDIGRGTHKVVAACYTFLRLFTAGFMAIVTDTLGFAILLLIRIQVIQHLAIMASIGVLILIFTNLLLLPILLSYTGVRPGAAERSLRTERAEESGEARPVLWRFLGNFTTPRWAGRLPLSLSC